MPEAVKPMKAVLAQGLPGDDDCRGNEIKWDGYRMIAFVEAGRVRLQRRNLLDATAQFPELGGLGEALAGHKVVLDGEIVGLDPQGRPSFSALQRRGTRRPKVIYMAFDDGAALFEATRASGTGRHHLQAARRPEGCYAGN
jgi:bifunctional non-homologous end joining protein LigD